MTTIKLRINGVLTDISAYIIKDSVKINETLFNKDLRPTTNKADFKISGNFPLIDDLLTTSNDVEVEILDGATYLFKGYLTDNLDWSIHKTGSQPIQVSAEDPGIKKLRRNFVSSNGLYTVYTNLQVCNPSNTNNSIVHKIATLAGITVDASIPSILDTTTINIQDKDGRTYWSILEDLLFDFQHVFYFDKEGEFNLHKIPKTTLTSVATFSSNTNIIVENDQKAIQTQKKIQQYKQINISWDEWENKSNLYVFRDSSNGDNNYDCLIPIAPNGYYPQGADANTFVYPEYKSETGQEIINVNSAELDYQVDSGITVEFENLGTRGKLRIKNTTASTAYIRKLKIKATDITLKKNRNTTRAGENLSPILDYTSKYIHDSTSATALANTLKDHYRFSNYSYTFKSRTNTQVGSIVTLNENLWSQLDVIVIIVGKETLSTGLYIYNAIGISTFNVSATVQRDITLITDANLSQIGNPRILAPSITIGSTQVQLGGSTNAIAGVTLTGTVAGNAETATKLYTPRTIGLSGKVAGTATSFDGSANITINTTALSVVSSDITDATNLNTASMVVKRDSSGNFSAGTITAALSGNASTATKLLTARTIAISGKVTASGVSFDGSGNITLSTTSAAILSSEITDATSANTASMIIKRDASGGFSAGAISASTLSTSGDVTIGGNLIVNGTTATINATTITVDDKNIELGSVGTPTNITADGGGITLKGATDKTILWDNTNANWTSSEHLNLASGKVFKINNVDVLSATTLGSSVVNSSLTSVGTLINLTVTNTISGSINGNAATATTLQTARTIAGVSFNGSANISIPFANLSSKPTTISGYGITDVGNGTLSLAVSGVGLSGSASFTANQAGNTTFTITSNATSSNTASTIVARDGSGNFTAGTITATAFSGSGASLTSLNASNLSSGSIPSARFATDGSITYNINPTIPATGKLRSNLGNPTIGELCLIGSEATNKLQFHPTAKIVAEYTTDNSIWNAWSISDTNKQNMVLGRYTGLTATINNGWLKARLTFEAQSYVYLNYLYIYNSTSGHSVNLSIEKSYDGTSWESVVTDSGSGSSWPGHFFLPHNSIAWNPNPSLGSHWKYVRVIFTPNWNASYPSNSISIYNIDWYGGYPSASRDLFTWDYSKNFYFPSNVNATTFIGALTGNATTATTLQTARNIAGVSFNGSANIDIPFANLITKPTTLAGYGITDASLSTHTHIDLTNATSSNTVSTLVKRDASGNFSAGTITATTFTGALTGNASTATTLQTARTIAGVSFNGSANIDIPFANLTSKPTTISGYGITDGVTLTGTQTLTNKAIAAGSNTISGLTNANLSGSAGITNANLANSSVTIGTTAISLGASSTTLAGLTSVTSTSFVGALTGNASTATTLQTARTIAITGKVTGTATSFNGSANISINATALGVLSSDISDATSANTASMVVKRDSSGNFSAGVITATSFTGTLNTAAQPNITSLGTLTSLSISGSITQSGNTNISNNFASGSVGTGWRVDYNSSVSSKSYLEVDNILVRDTLRTHIFQKDVIKATSGQLYISSSGVLADDYVGSNTIYLDVDKSSTFAVNDVLTCKDVNITNGQPIASVVLTIASVGTASGGKQPYTVTLNSGSLASLQKGMTIIKTSGGSILLDATTANNPFIDILLNGTTKARLGNLEGVVTGGGYGLWSDNVYLTGTITANAGRIGAWNIAANALYGGGYLANGTNPDNLPGTYIDSTGAIYSNSATLKNITIDGNSQFNGTINTPVLKAEFLNEDLPNWVAPGGTWSGETLYQHFVTTGIFRLVPCTGTFNSQTVGYIQRTYDSIIIFTSGMSTISTIYRANNYTLAGNIDASVEGRLYTISLTPLNNQLDMYDITGYKTISSTNLVSTTLSVGSSDCMIGLSSGKEIVIGSWIGDGFAPVKIDGEINLISDLKVWTSTASYTGASIYAYFDKIRDGVHTFTSYDSVFDGKNVTKIIKQTTTFTVYCSDGSSYILNNDSTTYTYQGTIKARGHAVISTPLYVDEGIFDSNGNVIVRFNNDGASDLYDTHLLFKENEIAVRGRNTNSHFYLNSQGTGHVLINYGGSYAGNVSIGASTIPTEKLEVNGNVKASGFIGNASSATVLQTARTIAGVSFNGSANISIPFANLSSKPTTLSGYGITDASLSTHTHTFASLTSKPTTLSGYGIVDAQPLDGDLTSIAAIAGTSGFLKKVSENGWTLDTNTYLTGNQTITVSGDATGSGTTAISLTLANSGVTAGTYKSVTVDAKGRVTAGTNPTTLAGYGITDAASSSHTHTFASLTSKPTTLAGYGITDAQTLDADLTAIAGLAGTTGLLKKTAANTWTLDTSAYITGNQTININGDATGSGATSISLTLANSGVTAGTYKSVTVDAKGRVTSGTNPTTLAGYGITDGAISTHNHNLDGLNGVMIANNTAGEILYWDGTSWINRTLAEAGIQPAGAYLTGNQSITISGDATGSGTTAITLTLANSGVTAGTYKSVTVDAKGRVTGGSNPTTLAGYGITDAQPYDDDLLSIAAISGTSGFLKKVGANSWTLDTNTYITGNQTITISGDASGSGTTAITLTLANSGVTAGTYKSVTVDAKGRVTGGTNPTTLSGYGITDAASSSHTHTEITNATSANTASTIVARDASGNFAGGTITATAFNATSKRIFKENIVKYNKSALDLLNSVEIVSFSYKSDNQKETKIGFIADDTIKELAGLNHDKMDLTNSIGLLIKAVQELKLENEELKKRLLYVKL